VSLGPQDLPEDPFGESGMAQLICVCTCELFHFVFTEATVRAVCSQCKTIMGEWDKGPRVADVPPMPPLPVTPGTSAPQMLPSSRDMLSHPYPGPPVQVGASWTGEPGAFLGEPSGEVPPLPPFSASVCDAFLIGGPYDGQVTWVGDDATQFIVKGVGVWLRTPETKDGRAVFVLGKGGG
jgi:hypothetical protein